MSCEFAIESECGNKCYFTNSECRYIAPSSEKCKKDCGAPYNYSVAKEYRKNKGSDNRRVEMGNLRKCIYKSDAVGSVKCYMHLIFVEQYVVEPSIMVGGHNGGQIAIERAVLEAAEKNTIFEVGEVFKCSVERVKFTEWEL